MHYHLNVIKNHVKPIKCDWVPLRILSDNNQGKHIIMKDKMYWVKLEVYKMNLVKKFC